MQREVPFQHEQFFQSNVTPYINEKLQKFRISRIEIGLLHICIDDLAMIISSQGYNFASMMMVDLSKKIEAELLKDDDIIFQADREHFTVILEGYNISEMEKKALEIFHYIINYGCTIPDAHIQLSAFIGGVAFSTPDEIAESLLNKAYIALNDAKEFSDHYVLYGNERKHRVNSKHQMLLANYVQQAFLNDKLCLAFQAVVDAKTKKPIFYESLLRIIDVDNNPISIGPFIPFVEKMGFIDVIDGVALKLAVSQLQTYQNLHLSVNVSSITIQQQKWLEMAISLLSDRNISSRLIVEITENLEYHNLDKLAHCLNTIKQTGCKIAMDDFGTGHTSFAQLKLLPIDIIKIDGSFVTTMLTNPDNMAFVQTLIELGKRLDLITIAEFVENSKIAEALLKTDIDYMQGNLFSVASVNKPWLLI